MTADRGAHASVRLTWLGQSSFVIDAPECRIGLDLYLSDHLAAKYRGTDKPHDRLHGCPLSPADLTDLSWVFASHRHSDHLDPESIRDVMLGAARAVLVLPAPLVDYAADLGVPKDRIHGALPGERVGPFLLVPAAHPEPSDAYLSAIVDVAGLRIFHSGDTVRFDEQAARLREHRPDVVLLPANGRVAEHLGTPPNMSLEEAIDLARECDARLLIPHHYDLFAFNSRPAAEVREVLAASGIPHLVPAVGQPVDLDLAVWAA